MCDHVSGKGGCKHMNVDGWVFEGVCASVGWCKDGCMGMGGCEGVCLGECLYEGPTQVCAGCMCG